MEELAEHVIAHRAGQFHPRLFRQQRSEAVGSRAQVGAPVFLERGEPQRSHFIARRLSYHGATLGALAVGGNEQRRAPYAPLLIQAAHIAPCYAYRHRRENESEAEYAARAADELEQKIRELGEDRVIAFIAETVVGATAGVCRR